MHVSVMLSWFVDKQAKGTVLARKKTVNEDVEIRPERVPASCLDENVCLQSIIMKVFYRDDALSAAEEVLQVVKNNTVWYCGFCTKPISDEVDNSM